MIATNRDQLVLRGSESVELGRCLSERKISRVFLVTAGQSYFESGASAFIDHALHDCDVERFYDFSPNPVIEEVVEGSLRFLSFVPDCVIGVGGGSAIDMAKLINYNAASGLKREDHEVEQESSRSPVVLPLIAVPTTAGSGSEATPFAVMYKDGVKYSIDSPALLPEIVVLLPELTDSLSPYTTACSGFDALAQAIESHWSVASTQLSRECSEKAIRLCLRHLPCVVERPKPASRSGMMEAAHLAGCAIAVTRTTAAHALSYVLTSRYGLPHGHAVAMTLPAVFSFNGRMDPETISGSLEFAAAKRNLAQVCGILDCDSADQSAHKIRTLGDRIGLDRRWIKSSGCGANRVVEDIVSGVNLERLKNNPRHMTDSDLRMIAEKIVSGNGDD